MIAPPTLQPDVSEDMEAVADGRGVDTIWPERTILFSGEVAIDPSRLRRWKPHVFVMEGEMSTTDEIAEGPESEWRYVVLRQVEAIATALTALQDRLEGLERGFGRLAADAESYFSKRPGRYASGFEGGEHASR